MNNFLIIAGPCLAESKQVLTQTVEHLLSVLSKFNNIDFYFKSSYKKANRTSINSFTGVGEDTALNWLADIKKEYNVKILTDIHSKEEAKYAAEYVDVLQIPAFLSRQTEILIAAGQTNLICNIKKGQFLAPDDMLKAADKIKGTGNSKIWLTERGTAFGYHDLVVDFRSLVIMKDYGYPIIYDATHSLQKPSLNEQSGGLPHLIQPLAKAATAVGIDGLFVEVHPNPQKALSDAATQLKLDNTKSFFEQIMSIRNVINQ